MAFEAFVDMDKGPPDFKNEDGFEFRLEKSLTRKARSDLGQEWSVWLVSGGSLATSTYLLCKGTIETHEDRSFEGMASHIDIMRIAINGDNEC